MLGSRDQSTGHANSAPAYSNEQSMETQHQSAASHTIPEIDINDDEIPF